MRAYRAASRAKKRAEAGLPEVVEQKPDVWLDWSGISAVVRCELCNRNFGTWLSQAEGSAQAEAHRRWHAYTRKEYQGGTQ